MELGKLVELKGKERQLVAVLLQPGLHQRCPRGAILPAGISACRFGRHQRGYVEGWPHRSAVGFNGTDCVAFAPNWVNVVPRKFIATFPMRCRSHAP